MDAPEVNPPKAEILERKPVGKWWHGTVAGVIGALIGNFMVFRLLWDLRGSAYIYMLYFGSLFIGGFLAGSLGYILGRRAGRTTILAIGGIFGAVSGYLISFNLSTIIFS